MPEISVIMGIYYNRLGLDYLEHSIQSIRNQSFSDFELLICDDGSSSEAKTYLDQLQLEDQRIRLIRPGNAYDLAKKLNVCLKEARGMYIARMDDDDFSRFDRFRRQLEFLKMNPQIAFVGCNVNLIRDDKQIGKQLFPALPMVRDFFMVQPFIHPTLMFRTQVLREVNGYSEKATTLLCEDYDLLLRLYYAGYQGANLQQFLFDYTIPDSAKGRRTMRHRWNEVCTRFERFLELGQLPAAFPYVLKPLLVGMLPEKILYHIKEGRIRK